jgi:hypothetical protein
MFISGVVEVIENIKKKRIEMENTSSDSSDIVDTSSDSSFNDVVDISSDENTSSDEEDKSAQS